MNVLCLVGRPVSYHPTILPVKMVTCRRAGMPRTSHKIVAFYVGISSIWMKTMMISTTVGKEWRRYASRSLPSCVARTVLRTNTYVVHLQVEMGRNYRNLSPTSISSVSYRIGALNIGFSIYLCRIGDKWNVGNLSIFYHTLNMSRPITAR